jgi:hypothetical protein
MRYIPRKTRRQSPESIAAYRRLFGHFSTLEAIIMDAIKGTNGFTREELSNTTGIALPSICGRVRPMLDRGLLVRKLIPGTDQFEFRINRSGHKASVLIMNPNLEVALLLSFSPTTLRSTPLN